MHVQSLGVRLGQNEFLSPAPHGDFPSVDRKAFKKARVAWHIDLKIVVRTNLGNLMPTRQTRKKKKQKKTK